MEVFAMLNFFDAVASIAALVWALAVGAYIFLAIDWDGLFEAKYIKVFLVVAIIAQPRCSSSKKLVLFCIAVCSPALQFQFLE